MVSGSYVFQEHVEKLMQSVTPLRGKFMNFNTFPITLVT
jgi:hypothetical protein